jgi:hypothetical protein
VASQPWRERLRGERQCRTPRREQAGGGAAPLLASGRVRREASGLAASRRRAGRVPHGGGDPP